jgi:hypothetical protein
MTYTIAKCTVNKLLMMGRGTAPNMESFMPKQICEISASSYFYYKEICCDARSHERKISLIHFASMLQYRFFLEKFRKHILSVTQEIPSYFEPEKIRRDNSPRHTTLSTRLAGLFLEYPS